MFCGECGRAVASSARPARVGAATKASSAARSAPAQTLVEPTLEERIAALSEIVLEPDPVLEPEHEPEHEPGPEPESALGPEAAEIEAEAELESTAQSDLDDDGAPVLDSEDLDAAPSPTTTDDGDAPELPRRSRPSADGERCAQCDAALDPADIFCGECGFVRGAAARRPIARDTAAYDPFPWGLPPGQPLPDEAAAAGRFAEDPFEDEGDTRLLGPGAHGERFVLQFSTGESFSVAGTGLLGRNPQAEPGEYFDSIVAISDPGRSVSKTHLEFGQDGGTFWVSDRFSGNGTVMREPDQQPRRCEAGKRYRVVRGTRIEIGEQFFIVS